MSTELLELALRTAIDAASFVKTERGEGRVVIADTKSSPTDVVTELDRRCEALIRATLLAARPDDGFLGEEEAEHLGASDTRWIVDPIDGTVNFVYGLPSSAVSIAAERDGVVVAGCVVNISTGVTYGAVRGEGSFVVRDGIRKPLTAPEPTSLAQMLVGTGFSYERDIRLRQAQAMVKLITEIRDIRRIGSAALDLCAVADGSLDAYVEQGLKPWDLAAGGLIAEEAGVVIAGLDGPAEERLTMACHPALAGEYFALIKACGF
ncbi:inositol monophosphatase family protein [soil metagenome]